VIVTGMCRRHKNDGFLWSIISKEVSKHKKTVLKSLKIMLNCYITNNGIKKVLAETSVNLPEGGRLLQHLGFVKQRRTFNNEHCFYKKVI